MTNRTIKHEIKLQKSVIIILGILAVGVFANAFAPAFSIATAYAEGDKANTVHKIAICNTGGNCADILYNNARKVKLLGISN